MLLDEARLVARIQHPNVTQIWEVGEDPRSLYIVMELVEGDSLDELRIRAEEAGETLPIAPDAERALAAHAWPGNVRELKHVLERAAAFADAGTILLEHLPATFADTGAPEPAGAGVRASVRERIVAALAATGGNRTRAAELLGLPRRTLVYKLSKLGLKDA